MSRPFLKMNGLGNDFVVVEARTAPFAPTAAEVRAIADRKSGVGCDQLVSIEPSEKADARVRFWNADGDEVGACGNASRCVGWLLMEASGRDQAVIETQGGLLTATRAGGEVVPASEYRLLQDQVRELQRMLGKKTMENEILREAVSRVVGPKKTPLRMLSSPEGNQ